MPKGTLSTMKIRGLKLSTAALIRDDRIEVIALSGSPRRRDLYVSIPVLTTPGIRTKSTILDGGMRLGFSSPVKRRQRASGRLRIRPLASLATRWVCPSPSVSCV